MPRIHKRKSFFRRNFNLSTAQKALNIALATKKLLNVELKHIDIVTSTINPSNSGTVTSLNHCAEGVTSGTRNGLSIRAKSLNLHFKFNGNASATDTVVKVHVVVDRSPNGTMASYLDVMEEATVVAQTNNINWSRFKIIATRTIRLADSGFDNGFFSIYKKLNLPIKYENSNGTQDDIISNQLLLLITSDESANTPAVKFTSRVRYLDN